MSFDFLKNVKLADNKSVIPQKERAKRPSVETNPTGLKIRLFKDGRVFPSQELVDKYDLEFRSKDSEIKGYGFDIVRSDKYPNYPKDVPQVILIAAVPRTEGKVDLFASCNFVGAKEVEKDPSLSLGEPLTSVISQGTATFGKEELIPMLKEIYNFEFAEEQKFVDLQVVDEYSLTTEDGIYHLPKTISRGAKKGTLEYVRRENIVLNPLSICLPEVSSETTEEVVGENEPETEEVE